MGRILIVDDRKLFPDIAEPHRALVRCVGHLDSLGTESFVSYEAVFIHEHNRDEWEAAIEAFDEGHIHACASFTGEEDTPSVYKGVHTLPRSLMRERFASFLYCFEHAEQDVETCMNVFHDPDFADRYASSPRSGEADEQSEAPLPVYLHVSVDESTMPSGSFRRLRVEADADGRLDYAKAFSELTALDGPAHLMIDETYFQKGDGLDLLLRLRLKATSAYSRWPVYMRLKHELTQWIRQEPAYMVAAMKGTHVVGVDDAVVAAKEQEVALSKAEHLQLLEQLPLTPKDLTGRHDRANEWGPVQFYVGLEALRGDDKPEPAWVTEIRRRLSERRYYSYLFALQALRAATGETGRAEPNHADAQGSTPHIAEEARSKWIEFLHSAEAPVRMLLLDDEADKGWRQAFESLFEVHPSSGVVEAPFQSEDFQGSLDEIAQRVAGEDYDIVLCDMRLRPGIERNVTHDVDELSGIQLLQAVKKARPDCPVIAFTASNKSWMLEEALTKGADGYWVKEAPDYDVRLARTVEHVGSLLDVIRSSVQRRRKLDFLWKFSAQLTTKLKDEDFVARWEFSKQERETPPEKRLQAIVRRLKQAYWLLLDRRSAFEASVFDVRQVDMAFLSVWSCFEEIHALHFQQPAIDDFQSLKHDSVAFYFLDPRDRKWKAYWQIENAATVRVHDDMDPDLQNYLCPEGKDGAARYPKDRFVVKQRVQWLLWILGNHRLIDDSYDLIKDFHDKRILRNKLHLQHGETESVCHAELNDIRDLSRVWQTILLSR